MYFWSSTGRNVVRVYGFYRMKRKLTIDRAHWFDGHLASREYSADTKSMNPSRDSLTWTSKPQHRERH
jgi:hypothetical protein